MAFDGNEGGIITLEEGAEMTSAYRKNSPEPDVNGHFFGRDILEEILKQEGCMGIRIYYGLREEGTGKKNQELVIVGADGNEDDMLNLVGDISIPCPTHCGKANPLNS
ncbi:MAG: hypothetical protein ACI837_000282 [Crocinitomicaceae bacterium]|jgi:hypothetical protein